MYTAHMGDKSLPDYKNEPSEYDSVRQVKFSHVVASEIKLFTNRIRAAHSVAALEHIKTDVARSSLCNSIPAKEVVRRLVNARAAELGFKGAWWNA